MTTAGTAAAGAAGAAVFGAALVAVALRIADHGAAAVVGRLVDGMARAGRRAAAGIHRRRALVLVRSAGLACAGAVSCGAVAALWSVAGRSVPLVPLAVTAAGCGVSSVAALVVLVWTVPALDARLPDGSVLRAAALWLGAAVSIGALIGAARHQGGASWH